MTENTRAPSATAPPSPESAQSLSEHIEQNVESIVNLQRREMGSLSPSQRRVERASRIFGRPAFLVGVMVFVTLWVAFNLAAGWLGASAFDPVPFAILSSIMTLGSWTTTTIVLIAQNRQTRFEQQQAHLDLQVSMLTEQKVTKLIHLIEELRRDLPMVRDRHDPQAAAMQESADAQSVLSAIEDRVLPAAEVLEGGAARGKPAP